MKRIEGQKRDGAKNLWLVMAWQDGRQVGAASQHSSRIAAWKWMKWTMYVIPGVRFTVETVGD